MLEKNVNFYRVVLQSSGATTKLAASWTPKILRRLGRFQFLVFAGDSSDTTPARLSNGIHGSCLWKKKDRARQDPAPKKTKSRVFLTTSIASLRSTQGA